MASEPADATLRMLREIRAAQVKQGETLGVHGELLQSHGAILGRVEKRVEDLYRMSTHTLGVAVTAHERIEAIESRLEKLSDRVERLEVKQ